MFYLIFLLQLSFSLAVELTVDEAGATFSELVSLLVSRGVYFILAFLIALCFVITTVKNKIEERTHTFDVSGSSDKNWPTAFWGKNSSQFFSLQGTNQLQQNSRKLLTSLDADEIETIKDRLREAEITVGTLRTELDHANKSRIDLEATLDAIERDKLGSDDELQKIKMDGVFELEELRKVSAMTERKLQLALEEKEQLNLEVDCLRREGRMTESVLKDQKTLVVRLEKARSEIDSLKIQMKNMKAERDMAVRLATDMMEKAKGVASRDSEQRQLIEEMIDAELKRVREEDEDENNKSDQNNESEAEVDESNLRTYNRSACGDSSLMSDNEERVVDENKSSESGEEIMITQCVHSDFGPLRLSVADSQLALGQSVGDLLITNPGNESNGESRSSTDSSDSRPSSADEETDSHNRLVTGSPAFRAFLNSLAQRES